MNETSLPWTQVPVMTEARRKLVLPPAATEIVAFVVAVIGPVVRAQATGANRTLVVLGVGATASVLIACLPERWWAARLTVLLIATAALERAEGPIIGVWVGLGLLLADWGIRRRRPIPAVPAPPATGMIPVAILVALATYGAAHPGSRAEPLRALFLALVVTLVGSLVPERLDAAMKALGRAAGTIVGRAAFFVVGLVVLVVPWLAHRLLRVDPLTPPGPDGRPGWLPRGRLDPTPGHPWNRETTTTRHSRWFALRRTLAVPLLVGSIVAIVAVARSTPNDVVDTLRPGRDVVAIPAAYEGLDWYPTYVDDINWAMNNESGVWHPLRSRRFRDFHTRTVNVTDGSRHTWTPRCDCRPLVVWVYGGSALFGIGQRDDHTIPSELARVAWRHGMALRVVNKGNPADNLMREVEKLSWDLTDGAPPDLVLFYDGANEDYTTSHLLVASEVDQSIDPLTEEIWYGIPGPDMRQPPEGGGIDPSPSIEGMDPEGMARVTIERYERSMAAARALGDAYSLPIRWAWQPVRASRPSVAGEPHREPADERELRRRIAALESRIPTGVIDLTDSLSTNTDPLYSDDVHHNEVGARLVAEALWPELRTELVRLTAGTEPGP